MSKGKPPCTRVVWNQIGSKYKQEADLLFAMVFYDSMSQNRTLALKKKHVYVTLLSSQFILADGEKCIRAIYLGFLQMMKLLSNPGG